VRPLGAYATTRGGTLYTNPQPALAQEVDRLPQAPYPPSEWDTAEWMSDTAQEELLQKYGPERYQAYLTRTTSELGRYHPDWRLVVGLSAAAIALVLRSRRR